MPAFPAQNQAAWLLHYLFASTTSSITREESGHVQTQTAQAAREEHQMVASSPVGRLFTDPIPRCDSCGSRVLELLYCQPCGEVFLGGYKKLDPNSSNAWFLSPDYPNLDQVPDRSAWLDRKFGEYLVFWPANGRTIYRSTHAGPQWRWMRRQSQVATRRPPLTIWPPDLPSEV